MSAKDKLYKSPADCRPDGVRVDRLVAAGDAALIFIEDGGIELLLPEREIVEPHGSCCAAIWARLLSDHEWRRKIFEEAAEFMPEVAKHKGRKK